MRTRPSRRRVPGAAVLAFAVVLASCSSSAPAATDPTDQTVPRTFEQPRTSTERLFAVTAAIEARSAITNGGLPWHDCLEMAQEQPLFTFLEQSEEPTEDWIDEGSELLEGATRDDYGADDLEGVLRLVDVYANDQAIGAWKMAGFDGASHLRNEDVDPPIDIVVSGFRDHAKAVDAAHTHLLDLCMEANSTLPLDDWSGVKIASMGDRNALLYVVGRYEVYLSVDRRPPFGSVFGDLQRWRYELREMIDGDG
ncbi:MAG: hypothetical protein KF906_01515 [Actinobacteria bacterium]|nr:hypothetical protein [Actinomycetota bacterium]